MKFLPGPETLFLLGALMIVPALLARFIVGAGWVQVGCAFLVWYLGLFLLAGGPSSRAAEAFGWTIILSIFFSWVGVPVAALVMRLTNLPFRFL